jgi:hypothetical protein
MIDKEFYENQEEANLKKVQENTSYYLESYLTPNRNWDNKITPQQRLNLIRFANVNWKAVSHHIKSMEYRNFLNTPYWKAIAAHTKYKAGYRCQLCNNRYKLVTHHRDYSIHGFEHACLQELIVICDGCHNKFHDQTSKWKHNTTDYDQISKLASNTTNAAATVISVIVIAMFIIYFLSLK